MRTRIVSALAALFILLGTVYFFKITGLKVAIFFLVLACTRELNRVLFVSVNSRYHSWIFFIFNILIYLLSSWRPNLSGLIYSFFFVCFSVFSITVSRTHSNLNQIADVQSKSALGFFYVGLLPAFATYLLDINNGLYWFMSMLCVVFAGDIGAYLVGNLMGKKKIMPNISPKKTLEGAAGGLIFSFLAGLSCSFLFPHVSQPVFCALSIATGVIAQFGDYFESLLKRVANVKDSGGLMPGHGGVLDRLDGVLFASPVFLLGAIVLEKMI